MDKTTYGASSGDGTICNGGMTLEQARQRAQEIANKTGESAEVFAEPGEEGAEPVAVFDPEIKATIHERGNGLADVGDFVAGDDGEVYRVVKLTGPIHTGDRPGAGNYMHATVALADWNDVSDDEEPTCNAILGQS